MTITKTNFEFRNKFKKLLNEENTSNIIDVFEKFCTLSNDSAIEMLWQLTYNQEIAYTTLNKLGLASEAIPSESIHTFRNELRVQYEKSHPNFLNVTLPKECEEAFENLVKQTTDPILGKVVFKHCFSLLSVGEHFMNRMLFLLNSNLENNYFGGIRSLCFNIEEAEYLKPFHMQIYNLLKAMNNCSKQVYDCYQDSCINGQKINFEEGCVDDLPFYMEEEEQEEDVEESYAESLMNDEEESFLEFLSITPDEILKHREVFQSFIDSEDFNLLIPIFNIGFDLNEVMLKKEEISNFLSAIKALS